MLFVCYREGVDVVSDRIWGFSCVVGVIVGGQGVVAIVVVISKTNCAVRLSKGKYELHSCGPAFVSILV